LKLNLLKLRETQKLVQANTKQAHRFQAQEIKQLQSEVSSATLAQKKSDTAKVHTTEWIEQPGA
jgi:hypothetical protein